MAKYKVWLASEKRAKELASKLEKAGSVIVQIIPPSSDTYDFAEIVFSTTANEIPNVFNVLTEYISIYAVASVFDSPVEE